MASTEHTILTDFLLPPAPLPALISLKAFTGLFPHSQQSSPEIKSLYRDLQHQRATIIDSITQNIVVEVKRGNVQCRAVVKARRAAERELQDDEADVEFALFGITSSLPVSRSHTLSFILSDMESAVEDVEDEIRKLEEEVQMLSESMKATVGEMSDLRCGRLANGQLREQVLDGLSRLDSSCEKR